MYAILYYLLIIAIITYFTSLMVCIFFYFRIVDASKNIFAYSSNRSYHLFVIGMILIPGINTFLAYSSLKDLFTHNPKK